MSVWRTNGVSRMGNTGIVFIRPEAKVNSEYVLCGGLLPDTVQNASATHAAGRRAVTHCQEQTRTCSVRTLRSSSLTCGPQTAWTWIQSITLFGVPFNRWSINVDDSRQSTMNQLKQAIVTEWGELSQRFIDCAIGQWRRRLEYVVHIEHWCKSCRMW